MTDRWHKASLDSLTIVEQRLEKRATTSLDRWLLRLGQAGNAKKTIFFQKDGVVTDERTVIDNNVRLEATKMGLKLHDAIPSDKVDTTHHVDQTLVEQFVAAKSKMKNGKSS